MTEMLKQSDKQSAKRAAEKGKKSYLRPALIKLGTLRDMTLSNSFGGPDGMPFRGTGRGGNS